MPCLLGCLALLFPRVVLVLVWLLGGGYLGAAFPHWIWPVLGFLFMPLTTLAFAFSVNSLPPGGAVSPLGWILIVLAGLIDLGMFGGGSQRSMKYVRRYRQ